MKNFKNFIWKVALVFCMALMFGILGSGNAYAANLGQQLTAPENGWQRIDSIDSKILYTGTGWSDYTNNSNGLNGTTERFSYNGSNEIKFRFYGTSLRLIESKNSDRVKTYVSIDGIEESYNSYDSSIGYQYLTFQKTNLASKLHEVVLYNKGEFINNKNCFGLDAIDIDSNGHLVDPLATLAKGISLSKSADSLQVGQTDNTLTATITPDNATSKNVIWKSSDESIATVDSTGKVTAVKEGTATITATTTDGSNLNALCVVTVIPKGTTPTNPTDNTGNAILTITMTNGNVKSYTVPMSKVNDFISWYDNRVSGSAGKAYYIFDKTDNLQSFSKKTEYIVFDKISSYEVDEYTK